MQPSFYTFEWIYFEKHVLGRLVGHSGGHI